MNIRTIAKIAECSPATVSRVLSGNHGNVPISPKTREKILRICREQDYEPNIHASRMFSKRSGIIGLATSGTGVEDENLSRFISGVYSEVSSCGSRLLLLLLDDNFLLQKEYLTVFRRREVDALIIWGAFGDLDWLDELSKEKYPFILASNCCGDYPAAVCDEAAGMKAMVKQCLSRGAKSFVHVDGGEIEISRRRREGFIKAVKKHSYNVIKGDFTVEAGLAAAEKLLPNLPDAIICVNDLTAIGITIGLKKAGVSIPEDVMITGADNIRLARHIDPALTTYDQMAQQCGKACVDLLSEYLDSGKPLTSCLIPPEVHFRESTFTK